MFKRFFQKFLPTPLDRLLRKACRERCKKVLLFWNRGLGDLPLGLYAVIKRIRDFIPEAQITFLVRPDLKEGFQLFRDIEVIVVSHWVRGEKADPLIDLRAYDLIIENPNPSDWVSWQLGKLIPRLEWNFNWNNLYERFELPEGCVAVHVDSETRYKREKNWPIEKWKQLFALLPNPIVLFGLKKQSLFEHPRLFDLRGKTTLFEILSILQNKCHCLVAPDSGILNITYFLDVPFKLRVISLWGDSKQGILKQRVPSPNLLLEHFPFIGKSRSVALISVEEIEYAILKGY